MPSWMKFVFADNTKSGKREVANLILLLWGIVYIKLFFFSVAGPLLNSQKDLFKDLNPWCLGFVAAAYGLDFYMKAKANTPPPGQRRANDPKPDKGTLPAN